MKKFNAIDLFCGAGGLSLGFQQAGFNIIVGVDNEQAALDTFEFNHKGAMQFKRLLDGFNSKKI